MVSHWGESFCMGLSNSYACRMAKAALMISSAQARGKIKMCVQVGKVCTCTDVERASKTASVPTVIHHTKSVTSKCKQGNGQDERIVCNLPSKA
jgi:hypothetical protein